MTLTAIVVYALGLIWIATLPPDFQLDRDEGGNLMKARLVGDGFRLYSQIWSDQPPGFTYTLAGWWRVFGETMNSSRTLIWTFTVLLLWTTGRSTVRLSDTGNDELAGWLAVVLMLGARRFFRSGISVLIGIPALATAMLAVLLLIVVVRRRHKLSPAMMLSGVVASGGLFGLSLTIKLFTFLVAPLALAVLCFRQKRPSASLGDDETSEPRSTGYPPAIAVVAWVISAVAVAGLVAVAAGAYDTQQLVSPHIHSKWPVLHMLHYNALLMVKWVCDDPAVPFCLLGLGFGVAHRSWLARTCLVWLVIVVAVMLNAKPLQINHRPLVMLPLVMGGAVGWVDAFRRAASAARLEADPQKRRKINGWRGLGFIAVGVVLAVSALRVGVILYTRSDTMGTLFTPQVKEIFHRLAPKTRWAVADFPVYTWEAGLRSPPELAVMTAKRERNGLQSEQMIADVIHRYDAEIVLLARFDYDQLPKTLPATHDLVYSSQGTKIYVRHDLAAAEGLKALSLEPPKTGSSKRRDRDENDE